MNALKSLFLAAVISLSCATGHVAQAAAHQSPPSGLTSDSYGACYFTDLNGNSRCMMTSPFGCQQAAGSFYPNATCY